MSLTPVISPLAFSQPTVSTLGATIHSNSSNISSLVRGNTRVMVSVPKHRWVDYMYRDYLMGMVMIYITELTFRAMNSELFFPLFKQALKIDTLKTLYPQQAVRNYANLDEKTPLLDILRKRIGTTTVNERSLPLVPKLMQHDYQQWLAAQPEALQAGLKQEGQVFIGHLARMLNFDDYLAEHTGLSPAEKLSAQLWSTLSKEEDRLNTTLSKWHANAIERQQKGFGLEAMASRLENLAKNLEGFKQSATKLGLNDPKPFSQLQELLAHKAQNLRTLLPHTAEIECQSLLREVLDEVRQALVSSTGQTTNRSNLWQHVLQQLTPSAQLATSEKTLTTLIQEGLESKAVLAKLARIKVSGFVPEKLIGLVLTLSLYGILSTKIDNQIIQTWQAKKFKQYGNLGFTIAPLTLSPLAALGAYVGISKLPGFRAVFQKLGYTNGFMVAGAVSIAAMFGAAVAGIAYNEQRWLQNGWLKNNPPPTPSRLA